MIRPRQPILGSFVKRLFDTTYLQAVLEVSANGLTRVGLGQYALENLDIPLPPIPTQQLIIDFLDRETAKIDALIAKQEQLITTLQEDRIATITEKVAGGAQLAQGISQFGWVEGLPADWESPQVGMHCRVGNGSTPRREESRYWAGGTIPWLSSSHVNRETVDSADQFVTEAAIRECHLPIVMPGSVLVGLTGQGKTRGMASLLQTEATINQHIAYITPRRDGTVDPAFLRFVLRSAYAALRSVSDENGSTKGGLTCEQLRKLRVPLPPFQEQLRIVRSVETATLAIDGLLAKSSTIIELLREYRSALIADAVTGKIDVREMV
ncbi:restriction endonuclease subunit S [Gordonia sp. NPDC003950]